MVRHIVMWNFADGLTDAQKAESAGKIKNELEALTGLIGGIKSLEVKIEPLHGSNMDIVLNSLFESQDALDKYQVHPEHVRVGQIVRPVTKNRACIDYIED